MKLHLLDFVQSDQWVYEGGLRLLERAPEDKAKVILFSVLSGIENSSVKKAEQIADRSLRKSLLLGDELRLVIEELLKSKEPPRRIGNKRKTLTNLGSW